MNVMDKGFIKRILLITGITLGVYLIFRYLLPLVVPFIFAALLAGCLYPVAIRLNSIFKIPYKISVAVTVILFTAILCALTTGVLYFAFKQARFFVSNYPSYRNGILSYVENICGFFEDYFGITKGKIYEMLQFGTDYLGENWFEKILPFVTERAWGICSLVVSVIIVFVFFLIGTALIMSEYSIIKSDFKHSYIFKKMKPLFKSLKNTLSAYFKTQLVIVGITAVVCAIGLFFLGNPYALIIGITIALIDAFPIVGSGMILIPWAVICSIRSDYMSAAVLMAVYIICMLSREILEPKIMGQQTGLRPIYTFISFYVGIQLFGILGVILGPIGVVIIKNVYLMTISPKEQSP